LNSGEIAQVRSPPLNYFPLSPFSGGEGQGEGVVVKDQTVEDRLRNSRLQKYARELRHNQTDAEHKFWKQVRNRRLAGLKFRRQRPIGSYIADFICIEKRLIVELDGGQHAE
jgi:hypothetical protein